MSEPSTFLQLVQRAHKECGFTGDGPQSVTSQYGMAAKLVEWVISAYSSICLLHDGRWRFLWTQTGGALAAGQETYTPLTDWATSVRAFVQANDRDHAAYVYLTASGTATRQWLGFLPWEQFRGLNIPANYSTTPQCWTLRPDGKVVYFPTPTADGWTSVHECYRYAPALAANSDEPLIPAAYRMAIVWRAVMFYAGHDKDGDTYQHAALEYDRILDEMRDTELPQWLSPGSLA